MMMDGSAGPERRETPDHGVQMMHNTDESECGLNFVANQQ